MPRKFRSFSTPMSQKVMGLVRISIFAAKKLRRPITAKLVFLRRRSGKDRLLRRYGNCSLEEYEFSPSDRVRGCRDDLFSTLLTCKCLGGGGLGSEIEDDVIGDEDDVTGDDVDRRAERFIERFYQEMRSQRRLSL